MTALLLNALACQNAARPPVWLMRQAGRYMPEYRELRKRYSFQQMCHQPELVAEVTLLPIKRLGVDAAILFSDILVVAEAFGRQFEFLEGIGPVLSDPLREGSLEKHDMEALQFVAEGIRAVRPQLSVPLIGFCGGPFTVASYLIEGRSSRDFRYTKNWLWRDPEGFRHLLAQIAEVSGRYLKMQVEAGVQAIQIFDSWAAALSPREFREFALPVLKQLVHSVNVPVILFCRYSSTLGEQAGLGSAALGVGADLEVPDVRRELGSKKALQGNIDPILLYSDRHRVVQKTRQLLDQMQGDRGFIVNLAHGVPPDAPIESVQALVDTVKEYGA